MDSIPIFGTALRLPRFGTSPFALNKYCSRRGRRGSNMGLTKDRGEGRKGEKSEEGEKGDTE